MLFNVVQFDCAHFELKVKVHDKSQGQCVLPQSIDSTGPKIKSNV